MRQIQFITHRNERYSYTDGALMALEGGCRWIQLRMKNATDDEIYRAAGIIGPACRKLGARLIIDDRVDLVRELHADGVHLGRNDMPIADARYILGDRLIIGGTANTYSDVERLWHDGANYIGCGPFRFTLTKTNLSPVLGLNGYRHIVRQMKRAGITLPIVAIGGILHDDVPAIMSTGVNGIALSSAVLNAENPVEAMRQFNKIINE